MVNLPGNGDLKMAGIFKNFLETLKLTDEDEYNPDLDDEYEDEYADADETKSRKAYEDEYDSDYYDTDKTSESNKYNKYNNEYNANKYNNEYNSKYESGRNVEHNTNNYTTNVYKSTDSERANRPLNRQSSSSYSSQNTAYSSQNTGRSENVRESYNTHMYDSKNKNVTYDDYQDSDEYDNYNDYKREKEVSHKASFWGKDEDDTKEFEEGFFTVKNGLFKDNSPRKEEKPVSNNRIIPMRTSNNKGFEVCIIRPTKFEDAKEICDMLKNDRSVIINIEDVEFTLAQRVMDFVCGAVYSLDARITQITGFIFCVSPDQVDISGDYIEMIEKGGFVVPNMPKR